MLNKELRYKVDYLCIKLPLEEKAELCSGNRSGLKGLSHQFEFGKIDMVRKSKNRRGTAEVFVIFYCSFNFQ